MTTSAAAALLPQSQDRRAIRRRMILRLIAAGDEVVVTYESTKTDGNRFRNTEVLTFEGEKICKSEVYFGWNLT